MADNEFPLGAQVSVNGRDGEGTIRGAGYGDGSLFRVELSGGTEVLYVRKDQLTLVQEPPKPEPPTGIYPSGGTFGGH